MHRKPPQPTPPYTRNLLAALTLLCCLCLALIPPAHTRKYLPIKDTLYIPDFYRPDSFKVADTTYNFLCYDQRDSIVCLDTITDFFDVKYISLFEHFIDYNHYYKDQGRYLPLPVTAIIQRFDRTGDSTWMSVGYKDHNKMVDFREYPALVTRIDTIEPSECGKGGYGRVYVYFGVR